MKGVHIDQFNRIGNQEIALKEFRGQRVVTFRDIDIVHERPDGTAKRNLSSNKERFIEDEDYIEISTNDVSYFKVKKPLSAIKQLQLTQQASLEVKADVDSVNNNL